MQIFAKSAHQFLEIGHCNSEIEQTAIYWKQTVAIFPLSERIINNNYQYEEFGPQALMSHSTSSCGTGEVETAVAVRAQEEGEGRYEKRK